ncbi:unnamed protein product [Soboliphyme baturini]|uniref:ATPase inhibitor, mitochondrial n=1 Tax=Soboliphyme baturini TaxID=241478 RepID=A0A183IQB7_9BILA|nr:unnamed protein product [Soboliphyme baturini]
MSAIVDKPQSAVITESPERGCNAYGLQLGRGSRTRPRKMPDKRETTGYVYRCADHRKIAVCSDLVCRAAYWKCGPIEGHRTCPRNDGSGLAGGTGQIGEIGTGEGKGGGAGGTIRTAGGAFGRLEAAREEEYFYKEQQRQLAALHKHLKDEVEHHEQLIKHHMEAMERHKKKISEIVEEQTALKKWT